MTLEIKAFSALSPGEQAVFSQEALAHSKSFPGRSSEGVNRATAIEGLALGPLFSPASKGRAWSAWSGNKPLGWIQLAASPWDEKILGSPFARIAAFESFSDSPPQTLELGLALLRQAEASLSKGAYCLARLEAGNQLLARVLAENGYLHIETQLGFGGAIEPLKERLEKAAKEAEVSPIVEADIAWAAELCQRAANPHDRFHADPHFSAELSSRFMRAWAEDGIRSFCDLNFKASFNGQKAGFVLWQKNQAAWKHLGLNLSRLVLGVVDPNFSGHGLYKILTAHAALELSRQGSTAVEMCTQAANAAAIKSWQALGFKLTQTQFTYRKLI